MEKNKEIYLLLTPIVESLRDGLIQELRNAKEYAEHEDDFNYATDTVIDYLNNIIRRIEEQP